MEPVATGSDDMPASVQPEQQLADGQSPSASAYDEARLIFIADLQKTRVIAG
jgi:hypothetical protein